MNDFTTIMSRSSSSRTVVVKAVVVVVVVAAAIIIVLRLVNSWFAKIGLLHFCHQYFKPTKQRFNSLVLYTGIRGAFYSKTTHLLQAPLLTSHKHYGDFRSTS